MGFLDKVKQTAQETLDTAKSKVDDVQAERSADKLLRDLGAWYYAGRTGRDDGEAAANIERIVAELQAHEATLGELGKKEEPPPPAAATAPAPPPPGSPAPPPAPPAAAAPPPAPPAAAAPPPPAPPAAAPPPPVTDGPPPPPPG
jgi:hypothetical protein